MACENIVQIHIVVVASCHCKVCRFEPCTIVVRTTCFMSTYEGTVYSATMLPIVADCSSNWCQSHCIGTNGSQKRPRHKDYPTRGIPDFKSFFLDCSQMRESYADVAVSISGFIRASNEPPRKNIAFFITYTRCVIHYHPNINPAI